MRYTMLLADDSLTTHRVMELTFAGQDIAVDSVADGEQALERIHNAPPDIVIAEVALPRLDGYRLAEHVRSRPELSRVPVLLMTGAFDVVDEARVQESGAAGIIVKPFEPETVINRVKDLLGLSSTEAAAAAGGRLVTSLESAPAAASDAATGARPDPPPDPGDDAAAARPNQGAGSSGEMTWNELRERLAPEPATASPADAGAPDMFGQLGDSFDDLDQQLSGSSLGPRTTPPPGQPPRAATVGKTTPSASGIATATGAGDTEPPVFEIDEEWFGGNLARATSLRTPLNASPDVADTFHALLAVEQGAPATSPPPEPIVIPDEVIDRIATRVAERLSSGLFVETVTRVVETVAERLVQEEIARIRARVDEQRR